MIIESSLIMARLALNLLNGNEDFYSLIIERIQSILAFILTEEPWSSMKQSLPLKMSLWDDSLINEIHKFLHHHPNLKMFQITLRIHSKCKASPILKWNLFIEYISSNIGDVSFLRQLLSSISTFAFYNTTPYKLRKRTKDLSFSMDQESLLKILKIYQQQTSINDILLLSFKEEEEEEGKFSKDLLSLLKEIKLISLKDSLLNSPKDLPPPPPPPLTIGHLLTNDDIDDKKATMMMDIDDEVIVISQSLPILQRISLCLQEDKKKKLKENPSSIIVIEKLSKALIHSLLVEGDFTTFTLLLQVLRLWIKGWNDFPITKLPPTILFPLLMVLPLPLLPKNTKPFYDKCYEIIEKNERKENSFFLIIPLLILLNLQKQEGKEGNAMKLRNLIFRSIIPCNPNSIIIKMICGRAIIAMINCIDLQQLEGLLIDSSKKLEPIHSIELLRKTCNFRGSKKLFTFGNDDDSPMISILLASISCNDVLSHYVILKNIELFLQTTPDLGPFDVDSYDNERKSPISSLFIDKVALFIERSNYNPSISIDSLIEEYLNGDPLIELMGTINEIKKKLLLNSSSNLEMIKMALKNVLELME